MPVNPSAQTLTISGYLVGTGLVLLGIFLILMVVYFATRKSHKDERGGIVSHVKPPKYHTPIAKRLGPTKLQPCSKDCLQNREAQQFSQKMYERGVRTVNPRPKLNDETVLLPRQKRRLDDDTNLIPKHHDSRETKVFSFPEWATKNGPR